jgi:pimeloyl-ACP methyl ester carboxylesterase
VLALHGWLDNAASFAALAPLIPGVRVIALDLPGHGHSAHRPAGVWYHYVDYVSDVLAAADALGLARFTLLGHSLGGAVASVIAAAAPDRVEALWLIEGLGPLSYPAEEALKHLRMGLSERSEAARKQLRVFPDVATAIAARRQAGGLSEAAASALVLRGIEACDGGWRWSSDPRLTVASPLRISETQIHAMLAGIECPTLLVLADPPAPYLATERMAQRVAQVKSIESVRIAGSHHLHLEDPQPVADAIAQFRRGLVGAA